MGEGLSGSSYPIRLGLCLCPRTHAAVGEVVVAAGDGTLNVIFAFLNGSWCARLIRNRLYDRHMKLLT